MIEDMSIFDLAAVLISRVQDEGLSNAKLSLQSSIGIVWTIKVDAVSVNGDSDSVGGDN
jgi:hypothetical protein